MNNEYLANVLIRICKQPRSFEYISKNMMGLDPALVLRVLNTLTDAGVLDHDDDYWVQSSSKPNQSLDLRLPETESYLKQFMGHFDFLKMPHPLDFEWRNTTRSLNHLSDRIVKSHHISESVLILGMPTLFANICHRGLSNHVTIIERNAPIVDALKKIAGPQKNVMLADVFLTEPSRIGKFDAVYMDPPWYPDFFFQFIWLGARVLQPGGSLVVSIPPINTRPGIDSERLDLISFCKSQGLCIESLDSQQLEYAMPFFEFNAFRADGIKNILPFWRKGDLIAFRKIDHLETERPKFYEKKSNWQEKIVNNVRIRVNLESPENDEPGEMKISNIVKGDILPTVSTRDERRKQANVWTSGNRIFHVNQPNLFFASISNRTSDSNKDLASEFTKTITMLENQEYKDYLEFIYYEMERQSN